MNMQPRWYQKKVPIWKQKLLGSTYYMHLNPLWAFNSLSSVVEQVSTKGGYEILGLLDFFGVNSDY